MKPLWKSRKFLLTVAGVFVVLLVHVAGIEEGTARSIVDKVVALIMLYVGVEGGVDAVGVFRKDK